MIAFNAAERILSQTKVGDAVSDLFSHPKRLAQQQRLALDYAQSRNAVLDVVWKKLSPILPETTS